MIIDQWQSTFVTSSICVGLRDLYRYNPHLAVLGSEISTDTTLT